VRSGRCCTIVLLKRDPPFDENVDRHENLKLRTIFDLTIELPSRSDTVERSRFCVSLIDGIIPSGRAVHR
jgi:hypothetical protein